MSLVKPAGWAFGEVLTSGQLEALDASQARAIDGTGGGTYAPTAQIVINGAGLKVSSLTVTGTLTLNGDTTIGNSPTDSLSVLATSTFSAPVTLDDALTANDVADFFGDTTVHTAAFFEVGGSASLGNDAAKTLIVGATATFNAPITANDTVEFWGDVSVHSGGAFHALGAVRLGSTGTDLQLFGALSTLLNLSGSGRVPFNVGGVLGGTTQTLHASDGQIFQTYDGILSAPIAYQLATSGASVGDWMLFFTGINHLPSQNITIANNGVTTIPSQMRVFGRDTYCWALFVYFSGAWNVVATND